MVIYQITVQKKIPDFRSKYNIWSVVNYLINQLQDFQSYWENSDLTKLLHKTLIKNQKIRCIIEDLINNKNYSLQYLTTDFTFNDFLILKQIIEKHDIINIDDERLNLLFSYLFVSGYLTITTNENKYALPNNKIKQEFRKIMIFYYDKIFNISPTELSALTYELSLVFSEKDYKEYLRSLQNHLLPNLKLLLKNLKFIVMTKNTCLLSGLLETKI